jgi:hypothetical protein
MSEEISHNYDSEKSNSSNTNASQEKGPSEPTLHWWARFHGKLKEVGFHDWLTLICTVVIAVATSMYTHYASKQWEVMRDSLKVTQDQLRQTRDAFRIDQRAYVWPSKIGFSPDEQPEGVPLDQMKSAPRPKPGETLFVNVYFRNTGKSPALDVKTEQHVVFGDKAKHGCFAFSRSGGPEQQSGSIIGVGGMIWNTAVSIDDDVSFPAKLVHWKGEEPILVYVTVQYRDIFGATHRSKTCAESLPNGVFKYVAGQSWMDY